MKTSSYFFVLISLIVFSSCVKRKDWHCECECKALGASTSVTKETVITDSRQNEANQECSDFGKAQVRGNGSWSCKITAQ